MEANDCTPSVSQAFQMKAESAAGKLTQDFVAALMCNKKANQKERLKIPMDRIRKYFPASYTNAQMEEEIVKMCEARYRKRPAMTAPLLRELIDHIDVYETEGTGKNCTQRVVIHYRFIGYLELPENVFRQSYKADTRQGVCVEYLRSPVTA